MADRLTRHQRRAIASYVADLQENMRLCGWRLTIARDPAPKRRNAYAVIWISDEAHEATIYIGLPFFKVDRGRQRAILVHELCHLILEPISWAVDRNTKPRGKNNHAFGNFRPAFEMATDDVAYLIAQNQPLPPARWLKKPALRG